MSRALRVYPFMRIYFSSRMMTCLTYFTVFPLNFVLPPQLCLPLSYFIPFELLISFPQYILAYQGAVLGLISLSEDSSEVLHSAINEGNEERYRIKK